MTSAEILAAFHALDERQRREALAVAARDALAVWRAYAKPWQPIEYVDSIVGMRHELDFDLPYRAMEEIEAVLGGGTVTPVVTEREYQEPIVAMQDGDLEMPDAIELAYYAIYNLHRIVFAPGGAERRPPNHVPGGDRSGSPSSGSPTDSAGAGLPSEQVVLDQVAGCTGLDADDWLAEWWTRVWDLWATSGRNP